MPPEALRGSTYRRVEFGHGYAADVYSAGVVLFNLVTGRMPYERASSDSKLFAMFERSRAEFWEHHRKHSFEGRLSEEIRELLSHMLEPQPELRWTLEQIKDSTWYKGKCASGKQITKEMRLRKASADLARTFPEKKAEIMQSYSARKRARRGSADCSLQYEKMGTLLWHICSSVFGV